MILVILVRSFGLSVCAYWFVDEELPENLSSVQVFKFLCKMIRFTSIGLVLTPFVVLLGLFITFSDIQGPRKFKGILQKIHSIVAVENIAIEVAVTAGFWILYWIDSKLATEKKPL